MVVSLPVGSVVIFANMWSSLMKAGAIAPVFSVSKRRFVERIRVVSVVLGDVSLAGGVVEGWVGWLADLGEVVVFSTLVFLCAAERVEVAVDGGWRAAVT